MTYPDYILLFGFFWLALSTAGYYLHMESIDRHPVLLPYKYHLRAFLAGPAILLYVFWNILLERPFLVLLACGILVLFFACCSRKPLDSEPEKCNSGYIWHEEAEICVWTGLPEDTVRVTNPDGSIERWRWTDISEKRIFEQLDF